MSICVKRLPWAPPASHHGRVLGEASKTVGVTLACSHTIVVLSRLIEPYVVTSNDIAAALEAITDWNASGFKEDGILPRGGDMKHCQWLYTVLASGVAWTLLVVEHGTAVRFEGIGTDIQFEMVSCFMRLWLTTTASPGLPTAMVIQTGFLQKTSLSELSCVNPIKFCLEYYRGIDLHVLLVMLRGYTPSYYRCIDLCGPRGPFHLPVGATRPMSL